jgi:trk system potassium uptake protein TrkH
VTPRPPAQPAAPTAALKLVSVVFRAMHKSLSFFTGGRVASAQGVTVGMVWVATAPVLGGCALIDWMRGGPDVGALLVSAAIVGAAGILVARICTFPRRVAAVQLFSSLVLGASAAIVAIMVPHLLTGTVGSLDAALVEATAAVTTTNASRIDPELMSFGMLLLRSLTQWAAGAAVIVMVVRVLPHLGTGGLDTDGGVATRAARRLSPRVGGSLGRLLLLYVSLTGLLGIAYVAAGMPLFDSLLHALTTISTGGFSSHSASIGEYSSAAIEWVTIGGMLIAGCSLPLVFLALRRQEPSRLGKSLEFRVYLVLIVFAAFSIVVWDDAAITMKGIRHALFAATSAVSTTGFVTGDWEAIPGGGQVLLVVLMTVGGMSASVAGGFKVVRLLALTGFVRRELVKSLHPEAVLTVHLGRSSISDVAMSRLVGDIVLALLVLGAGIVALAATGLGGDPTGLIGGSAGAMDVVSFAVSALGNVGPAFGSIGTQDHLSQLDPAGNIVASGLMFVGKVSVTPALVTAGLVLGPLRRRARFTRRSRASKAIR